MLKEQPRGIPFTLRLVGPKKAFGEWKMFVGFPVICRTDEDWGEGVLNIPKVSLKKKKS